MERRGWADGARESSQEGPKEQGVDWPGGARERVPAPKCTAVVALFFFSLALRRARKGAKQPFAEHLERMDREKRWTGRNRLGERARCFKSIGKGEK